MSDLKMFSPKFWHNMDFLPQIAARLCKNWIIMFVVEKNANSFQPKIDENRRK
jgi:hypothetical protein